MDGPMVLCWRYAVCNSPEHDLVRNHSILNPSTRTVPLPLTFIDLAHTLVSVAWLLVFLAQVILIATGRTAALHRRLGILGVLLSAAFIVVTWLDARGGCTREGSTLVET